MHPNPSAIPQPEFRRQISNCPAPAEIRPSFARIRTDRTVVSHWVAQSRRHEVRREEKGNGLWRLIVRTGPAAGGRTAAAAGARHLFERAA